MAISLIAKPATFSPAYNPLKFIYSSTNVNEDGFRYVFDVYESGTTNKIGEYRPLPRVDGYGEVDLSPLLRSKVTYTYNNANTGDIDAPDSFYKYDVKVGEEYITTIDYTSALTQNGTYVKITATHSFQVGDRVVISQADGGAANPNLEGLFTITAITTTTDFTINSLWSEVTDVDIDGSVKYSDNRKTVTRDIITSTNNYVYNGAIPFGDFNQYNDALYICNANTDKFLTNVPTSFYITPEQDFYVNLSTGGVSTGRMYFENDGGDILYYAVNGTDYVLQAAVGDNANPSNVVSGTLGHIKDNTDYYDFWYADNTGTQHSQKYRFYIDRRCLIEEYIIEFLDRMGSIGSFSFQLRSTEKGSISRVTYNQDIEGYVSASRWTYADTEFGLKTLGVNVEKTLTLNTNWMTEDMAIYFEELLTSPFTILKKDTDYAACIVQESSFEVEKQKNKNLIRKTITIKLANQNIING